MPIRIDCRGLTCPQPVIKTKSYIDRGEMPFLIVLVDNMAAKENVSRLLTQQGYAVRVKEDNDFFSVTGTRSENLKNGDDAVAQEAILNKTNGSQSTHVEKSSNNKKIMVIIGCETLGKGDDKLGEKLMINYIQTLTELGDDLWRLVFINGGVKLCIEKSSVFSVLQKIEKNGVQIFVCGTCLDHFGMIKQKKVGETTNMLDIVTSMQVATQVISLV